MINLMFPVAFGVCLINNDKKVSCVVGLNGKVNIFNKKTVKIDKKYNIFLIRGLIFFFIGIYNLIIGLFEYSNLYSKKGLPFYKVQKSLNVSTNSILYFLIAISSIVASYLFLGVLPIKISFYLSPKNYDMFLKRLIIAIVKCVIIYGIFLLLKYFQTFKQYYKFNSAIKKYQEKNSLVNFLTYFICSTFLCIFVINILGLTLKYWYSLLINSIIVLLCFALNYEIYNQIQKHKSIKWLIVPFYFLISQNPSQKENKCVNIVLKEIEQGNKQMSNINNDKISYSEAYVTAKEKLEAKNKFEPSDLDFIFCEVLNKNRAEVKLIKEISKEEYKKIMQAVERRASGEPVTKIFGKAYFYGLTFYVTKDVLSPRMDTEILVEQVIKNSFNSCKILDIGTGSGAIAITIAKQTNAKVTAVDISDNALKVAKQNAKLNGANVTFKKSDLFSNLSKLSKFDIIVSNPPYIPTADITALDEEVKKYDPHLALDGGLTGLDFYQRIIEEAPKRLKQNGKIFFEVGVNQAKDVKKLLQKNFKDIKIIKDYNKIDRVVIATLNI